MALTNFTMTRGDNADFTLAFNDHSGNPLDITEWTITFTLKSSWDIPDSDLTLQKIISPPIDAGTSGITALNILPADTLNIKPRIYDYDIQVFTGTGGTWGTLGKTYTPVKGKFNIEYDVTWGTAGTTGG